MEWLSKMRSQSDATKTKIAIAFAAVITLLIVGLWIMVMKSDKTADEAVTKSKSDELKPLFMIFKGAKEDWKTIKTEFKENKETPADVLE